MKGKIGLNFLLFSLLFTSQVAGVAGEEETIVVAGEESPPLLSCPRCEPASFYFLLDQVNAVDIRHETPIEDVSESLLRLDSGLTWKSARGRLGAKAQVRFDFLVAGAEEEGGGYGLSRSEVRFEPREWYVEFLSGPADMRVGSQFLRFSRSEIIAPGDFLSPYDLREPYRGEWSLPRLPVFAGRADIRLSSELAVTGALVPFFTPPRFDLFGTDQAILGPGSPDELRSQVETIEGIVDPSVSDRVRGALLPTELPEEWGPNQSAGIRIERSSAALDAGFTYLFTFGPVPEIFIDPRFLMALYLLDLGDWDAGGAMITDMLMRGEDLMATKYRRMHVFSMDVSVEAGPLVLTGEAGWIPEIVLTGVEVLPLPMITNVKAPLMTASIQAQYSYGEVLHLAAEAGWERILLPGSRLPPVLFFGDEAQRLTLALASRISFLRGKLAWNLTGQAGVIDGSLILSTRVSYEAAQMVRPFVGAVIYEVFGSRPDPDLVLAALRDPGDEIFFGLQVIYP